jgi:hypothetical protein
VHAARPKLPPGYFADKQQLSSCHHLASVMGRDAIDNQSFGVLLEEAFAARIPYLFAALEYEDSDGFEAFIDIKTLDDTMQQLKLEDPKATCDAVLMHPIRNLSFWGLVPWCAEPFFCGTVQEVYAVAHGVVDPIRSLSGSAMDSQARGLGYGFWMAGTRQLKNERLANFLFDRATFVERQEALEQGLAAACAMAPLEAVRALLDGGARAAPPKATQTLLPLTVAVQHGRIEVAQLLLQRGADPRQRAWAAHPRALQVAQGDPSLTALLQRDVDPQDSDAVLVPEDGTWQLQSIR